MYQYKLSKIINGDASKVNLSSKDRESIEIAYDNFRTKQAIFACNITRTNYNNLRDAGIALIKTQDRLGVWTIHPDNAKPGLAVDDSRILEV